MTLVPGMQIGPYRILEQLGQGGMATVYKTYHAALDRYVAIKVMHPAFQEDPSFYERFRREARVVARLDHPNIVPVYDFNEHEGRPYLVMKFIEGETLKARLKRGPLSRAEVLRVVEAVGAALAYAHAQGVLHRDVKPSNVLLGQDGRIYLTDFGLARIAQAGESTLSADMLLGTPQYISPEQAMGRKDLDHRTDIYSFGVMVYEMVVGRVPFTADTPYSIIHDHIYSPLPRPRDLNPEVSEAVERVLLKALAKEREDRYPSVEDFVQAFRRAWVGEEDGRPTVLAAPGEEAPAPGTQATPQGVPLGGSLTEVTGSLKEAPLSEDVTATQTRPRSRRRWWLWGLGALALGVCCLLGLAVLSNRSESTPAPTHPVPAAAPSPLAPGTDATDAGPAGEFGLGDDQPAQIQEILAYIADHPDDPKGYFQLAYDLAALGRPTRSAMLPLQRGLRLAQEQQNLEVLTDYAQSFFTGEMYLLAAETLLAMDPLLPETPSVRREWADNLRSTLYLATEDPLFDRQFAFDRLTAYDPALAGVLYARYELVNGDPERGQHFLLTALQKKPNMPEAVLVQAEYAAVVEQDLAKAQRLLEDLLARPALPEWVRLLAEEYLRALEATPTP